MRSLKDLLGKYSEIKIQNQELIRMLQEYFRENFNFNFKKDNFKINNNIIYFKVPPIIKTELLINKKIIISKIKLINQNILDIN